MKSSFETSKMKAAPPPADPFYIKYRVPIVVVLVLGAGLRFYASREEKAVFGDRVEKPRAELDRMHRELMEKSQAAEERRRLGRAQRASGSGAMVAPGQSPNITRGTASTDAVIPAAPDELKSEAMIIFAIAANGAGLRLKLASGVTHARLVAAHAVLSEGCLVPAGVPSACKAPITLEHDAWGALFACTPVENLAPGLTRVTPARALTFDPGSRKVLTTGAPGAVEIVDVFWKSPEACAAFAKNSPAVISFAQTYALGRGVP